MELVEKYREIILQVFREYTEVPVAHGDLQDEIIVDRERGSLPVDGQRISKTQTDSHLCCSHRYHQWKVVGSTR